MRSTLSTKISVLAAATILVTAVSLSSLAIYNVRGQAQRRIADYRAAAMDRHEEHVRNMVEVAYGILRVHHARLANPPQAVAPTQWEAQLQREVLDDLRQLRYAGGNYFWVNDMDTRMLMHPYLSALEGQVQWEFQDPDGVYLFREFVRIAREHGEGLTQYRWPRPGGTEPVAKLSYVKYFAPWDWVIGSGVYIDDIEATIAAETARVNAEVEHLVTRTGAITLGLIIASIWLVTIASRRFVTTPLEKAANLVRALSRDGSHRFERLPEGRSDEIGALHSAVNGMLANWEQMGDSLVAQRKFAEDLLHGSAVAAFVLAPDHRVLIWNPACEQLTGRPAADMVGTRDHWQPFYTRPTPTLADALLDGCFAHAAEHYTELRPSALAADGMHGERWVESLGDRRRYVVFDAVPIHAPSGELVAVVETLQDMAELKQTQEELAGLAAAVEQAAETIVVTTPNGRVTYANPAFETLTGFRVAEVLGNDLHQLHGRQLDPLGYAAMDHALEHGHRWSGRLVSQRRDGTRFHEITSIAPVHDAAGAVSGFVSVRRDISRELVVEKQLRQAQKLEAVGTLAGGISHEFNNLLLTIGGFTELTLDEVPAGGQAHRNLQRTLTATERAHQLVKQMAVFSRQREEGREELDLRVVIDEVVTLLRPNLPAGVTVDRTGIAGGVRVQGDPHQLSQLFNNLFGNALHAIREGHGTITVGADLVRIGVPHDGPGVALPDGEYLRVTVTDDGSGMSEEVLEQAFDPFFTTREVGEGTGLGLSVVHGVMRAHGGAATLSSQLGRGTTATLYFPQDSAASGTVEAAGPASGHGEQVLIIEDDPNQREALCQTVEQLGYRAVATATPEGALQLLKENPNACAAVLANGSLPSMGAAQLATELHRLRSALPVILCTAHEGDLHPASGTTARLARPLTSDGIAAALRRVLSATA